MVNKLACWDQAERWQRCRLWKQQDWQTIDFQTKLSLSVSWYFINYLSNTHKIWYSHNISLYILDILDILLAVSSSYITCPFHLLCNPEKLALTFYHKTLEIQKARSSLSDKVRENFYHWTPENFFITEFCHHFITNTRDSKSKKLAEPQSRAELIAKYFKQLA